MKSPVSRGFGAILNRGPYVIIPSLKHSPLNVHNKKLKGAAYDRHPQQDQNHPPPDCVTEIRMGNTVLTVSGYFKQDTTDTAADKMAKVLEAESRCQISPGP